MSEKVDKFISMLEQLANSLSIKKNSKWLEIGCGNGNVTYHLLENGFDCFGIDVEFKSGQYRDILLQKNSIKRIITKDNNRESIKIKNYIYTWPCDNEIFEFAFSSSVIEHIFNLNEFASENYRVLKKGGFTAHYFPARTAFIEPHTGIPFGGIFQNKYYYRFMVYIFLCRKMYRRHPEKALKYMKTSTKYLSRKDIIKIFDSNGLQYCGDKSDLIIKNMGPKKLIFLNSVKFIPQLFSIFRSRIMVFYKEE